MTIVMPMTIKPNSPICREVSERLPSEMKFGIVADQVDRQRDEQDDGNDVVHPPPCRALRRRRDRAHIGSAAVSAHSPIVIDAFRFAQKAR